MNTAKKILILAGIILFFSTSSSALEISGPEKMQSFAPFTFFTTLPSTDEFSSATLLFDGVLVATIYPTGTCSMQPDWIPFLIQCKTYDADPKTNEGLTAIITHTGFSKGAHSIAMQTQGSKSESQALTINVIDALDASEKEAIDASVTGLETRVGTLETTSTTNEQKIYETQSELAQTKAETQTTLEEVGTRLDKIEAPEPSLLTQPTTQGFSIPFLSNPNPTTPGTGLATGSNWPVIGLVVLVIGGMVLFFFARSKQGGFGGGDSTPFFEGTVDSLFKGVPSKDGRPNPQPHKWSADSDGEKGLREDVENNPPEKINFGDLIKQDRD